jgi:hypothetical protein
MNIDLSTSARRDRAPKLAARIRDAHEVSEADALEMFGLYESYYESTSFSLFRRDLAEKKHVIELRSGGVLRGFSTIQLINFDFDGAPNRAMFSGDTIIDSAFWGEQALVEAFCRLAGQTKAQRPALPLYWFLICKGYRTYRYLSLFAKDYFPHPGQSMPDSIRLRLEHLARSRFADAYSATTGLIRFPQSKGHLRPQWAQVAGHLREHAVVRYFLERNPDYHAGDELACLTELRADNLRSFAKRAFIEGLNRSVASHRAK